MADSVRRSPRRSRPLIVERLEDRSMLTLPTVYIDGLSAPDEGQEMEVTVTLSHMSEDVVTVDFDLGTLVANRLATFGDDFYLQGAPPGVFGGTITFAPFETQASFVVGVVNDTYYEDDEWLNIHLLNPVNAQLSHPTLEYGYDDWNVDLRISDPEDPFVVISQINEAIEPASAIDSYYARFRVELGGGWGGDYTEVDWNTSVGTGDSATAGDDFITSGGTIVLESAQPYADLLVPLLYDGVTESPETFRAILTAASNGITILVSEGVMTITDSLEETEEEPPPDCQCGTEVGRSVTAVSSDKGDVFWEGDTVTFTATLNSTTPAATETFAWERRSIKSVNELTIPSVQYNDWEPFGTSTSSVLTYTFDEPFIGQVRLKLTSAGTVSSQWVDARAKAAYPINFAKTGHATVGDHLEVTYTWASSSGRMADLDGVKLGEYVWYTWWGYYGNPAPWLTFTYPGPTFDYEQTDGQYWPLTPINPILGTFTDEHGVGVKIAAASAKSATAKQYYYYEITDGFNYRLTRSIGPAESGMETVWAGDAHGEVKFKYASITYSVSRQNGFWYKIDKGTDGSALIDLSGENLPWTAQ